MQKKVTPKKWNAYESGKLNQCIDFKFKIFILGMPHQNQEKLKIQESSDCAFWQESQKF